MNGQEFVAMMRQDIATVGSNKKHNLTSIVECMAAVVSMQPSCDIDSSKTAEECYKELYSYALSNKKESSYFMSPTESLQLTAKYLGIEIDNIDNGISAPVSCNQDVVNLDRFF